VEKRGGESYLSSEEKGQNANLERKKKKSASQSNKGPRESSLLLEKKGKNSFLTERRGEEKLALKGKLFLYHLREEKGREEGSTTLSGKRRCEKKKNTYEEENREKKGGISLDIGKKQAGRGGCAGQMWARSVRTSGDETFPSFRI